MAKLCCAFVSRRVQLCNCHTRDAVEEGKGWMKADMTAFAEKPPSEMFAAKQTSVLRGSLARPTVTLLP